MDEWDCIRPHLGGTLVSVLVTVFSKETRRASTRIAHQLRQAGINTEVYLGARKLGRQIAYADKKGIPIVAIAGPDEIEAGAVKLRRLSDGEEKNGRSEKVGTGSRRTAGRSLIRILSSKCRTLAMKGLNRSSGILLHPTSLPGRYGIGDLGGAPIASSIGWKRTDNPSGSCFH